MSQNCDHVWVMHMIQMPEGYDKPGATRCQKCGAYRVSAQATLTTTCIGTAPASQVYIVPPSLAAVARTEGIDTGLQRASPDLPPSLPDLSGGAVARLRALRDQWKAAAKEADAHTECDLEQCANELDALIAELAPETP